MPLTHDIGVRIPYPLPENGDSAAAELPFAFSLLSVHSVADAFLRGSGALRTLISFGVHSPVSLTAGVSVPLCAIGSLAVFGWCDADGAERGWFAENAFRQGKTAGSLNRFAGKGAHFYFCHRNEFLLNDGNYEKVDEDCGILCRSRCPLGGVQRQEGVGRQAGQCAGNHA